MKVLHRILERNNRKRMSLLLFCVLFVSVFSVPVRAEEGLSENVYDYDDIKLLGASSEILTDGDNKLLLH